MPSNHKFNFLLWTDRRSYLRISMAASQSMSNGLVGDYNIKSLIDSERYPNRRTEEPKKQHACLKNEYINADLYTYHMWAMSYLIIRSRDY